MAITNFLLFSHNKTADCSCFIALFCLLQAIFITGLPCLCYLPVLPIGRLFKAGSEPGQ